MAVSLMNNMTSSEVKSISFGAIEQLNLDLLQCESIISLNYWISFTILFNICTKGFANTVTIKGLPNETISLCFDDIRQVIDLIELTIIWILF